MPGASPASIGGSATREQSLSVLQAIVLGIVQGITEFAPISSSGHLILVPWLFGWDKLGDPSLNKAFDVALHVGTFVGAAAYFRKDIVRYLRAWFRSIAHRRIEGVDERIAWGLVVGTIPGAAIGGLFSDAIEDKLGRPWLIAAMLAIFGVVLYVVDRRARSQRSYDDIGVGTALFLGVAQAVALQPGVSRSGVTMTAGRAIGIDRASAARFSFLLALPVVGGAGVFKAIDVLSNGGLPPGAGGVFFWGFVASAISGFVAVWWLLSYLRRHAFGAFLAYRLALAALVLGLVAANVRPGSA